MNLIILRDIFCVITLIIVYISRLLTIVLSWLFSGSKLLVTLIFEFLFLIKVHFESSFCKSVSRFPPSMFQLASDAHLPAL